MFVRWVGFDMDECLGSFMSLWPYTDYVLDQLPPAEQDHLLTRLAARLGSTRNHWLFRPDLLHLLAMILTAYRGSKITGCFILSNNGSARLVELVRRTLNWYMGFHDDPRQGPFVAGWHRTAPCRRGRLTKSWDQVTACLKSVSLPPPTRRNDLLFYDDLDHVLAKEIPHYVRVPAYFHQTPQMLVHRDIKQVLQQEGVAPRTIDTALHMGERNEETDLKEDRDLRMKAPTPADVAGHMSVFVDGFRRFLADVPRLPSKSKTRKSRSHLHDTRKTPRMNKHPKQKSLYDRY